PGRPPSAARRGPAPAPPASPKESATRWPRAPPPGRPPAGDPATRRQAGRPPSAPRRS
ncbi:DUF2662 domain-containing protein, partial [Actinomadura sp. GC306]